jgi:hypothetical protein
MRLTAFLAASASALAVILASESSYACGGCFAPPPPDDPSDTTLVTAHRMALSISPTQTVLWDQFSYSGNPAEFAWVLPIRPGARVEIASDAWLDVLDAATTPRVEPPTIECGDDDDSCAPSPFGATVVGCGTSGAFDSALLPPDDDVTVVSRESAGPYEAVILRADDPEALPKWLAGHGYPIPNDVAPIIASYVAGGFDFVALRLLPGAGVQQMRPVRVIQPGAVPTLPLRMVAAGVGARTPITLFVVGEGRYEPSNFPTALVNRELLLWDDAEFRSNYAEQRDTLFNGNDGRTWITTYAVPGALFDEVTGGPQGFARRVRTENGWSYGRLSDAYVAQAFATGETSENDCMDAFPAFASDDRRVVQPCDEDGVCRAIDPVTEIDFQELTCDPPIGSDLPLDDLAVALLGQRPSEVWVTRLEANLPRAALDVDLELAASRDQRVEVGSYTPELLENSPCEAGGALFTGGGNQRRRRGMSAILGAAVSAALALVARRALQATGRKAEVSR